MGADRFSALSRPQRLALVGQLGCVGRLNAATACQELVQVIPYGLWPDDLPPLAPLPSTAEFRVMWSGSFNTWTDPETLSEGVSLALREEQSLHLEVLGGAIANYHEGGYARFRQGLEQHGAPMDRISLLDWQAYRALPDAYARCHAGLSLDRWTYEAVLGSRTRVVHMLAAGRPVVSTAVSELTRDMAEAGVLIPVETGHARSLADGLLRLARMNRAQLDHLSVRCRQVAEDRLNAAQMGQELGAWVREPKFAADHPVSSTNALVPYWREALVDMTS
jgi:glycosyltransferase involved in cell wall biosynthesis